jgi:2-oxoisovalerate dehydrogenase E1 component
VAESIDEYFTATILAMKGSARERAGDEPIRDGSSLTARVCLALFDVQLGSRHLDLLRLTFDMIFRY